MFPFPAAPRISPTGRAVPDHMDAECRRAERSDDLERRVRLALRAGRLGVLTIRALAGCEYSAPLAPSPPTPQGLLGSLRGSWITIGVAGAARAALTYTYPCGGCEGPHGVRQGCVLSIACIDAALAHALCECDACLVTWWRAWHRLGPLVPWLPPPPGPSPIPGPRVPSPEQAVSYAVRVSSSTAVLESMRALILEHTQRLL